MEKSIVDIEIMTPEVEPLPLPYVDTPIASAVEGITNVTYNGEYMYFMKPPVFETGHLIVPVRNAVRALGFKLSYEDGAFVGTKGNNRIEIRKGSNIVVYNNLNYTIARTVSNDRIPEVSLTELANIIGAGHNGIFGQAKNFIKLSRKHFVSGSVAAILDDGA